MTRIARELLLTTLTALTTLAALWSWSRITDGLGHALPTMTLTAVAVVVLGVLLRGVGAPRTVALLAQLAAAWSVVSIRIAHTPIPLRYAPRMRLENAFVAAGDAVTHSAPPVPVIGGVLPLVLCGAALALVLADLLARTLRLPGIAGLVLLAVVAVPISVQGSDAGLDGLARTGIAPWLFALVAIGWLAQVVLAEDDRLGRWGRQVEGDGGRLRSKSEASGAPRRAVAGMVGIAGTATALALALPLLIPSTRADFSGFGAGAGGNGKVTVTNPLIDVRQNLVQGADIPLVTVRTDDPDPSYLRIAVLTRFTSTQWSAGDRSIPKEHDSHGPVPIAGYFSGVQGPTYPYRISVASSFSSRWLPTPAPVTEIDADGDWRYDSATDDFIAAGKGLTTAGLSYSATRVGIDLTAASLETMPAGVGQVSAAYTDVPPDLPPIVAQTARQVTRGASTPLEEAVAIQDWFRTGGGFIYSTNVTLGAGGTDLATFLGYGPNSRRGYCQQFAAAMAAMARTLGIPSRVAVGFLSPTSKGDGSFVFSSHDMHAWPELYFTGAGWVRFEPTPAVAGTSVPSYAHRPSSAGEPTTGPSVSASTSAAPHQDPTARPDKEPPTPISRATAVAERHGTRWLVVVLVLGIVGALLALPRTVRRRRRRARLTEAAGPGTGIAPEVAWAELRDTAVDLRIPWSDGLSPRATRDRLEHFVVGGPGHRALAALTDALERERYAAYHTTVAPQVLIDLIAGLEEGETPRSLRRAHWWPHSLLRRPSTAATESTPELDRVG